MFINCPIFSWLPLMMASLAWFTIFNGIQDGFNYFRMVIVGFRTPATSLPVFPGWVCIQLPLAFQCWFYLHRTFWEK